MFHYQNISAEPATYAPNEAFAMEIEIFGDINLLDISGAFAPGPCALSQGFQDFRIEQTVNEHGISMMLQSMGILITDEELNKRLKMFYKKFEFLEWRPLTEKQCIEFIELYIIAK